MKNKKLDAFYNKHKTRNTKKAVWDALKDNKTVDLLGFKMERIVVKARPRKLNVKWLFEDPVTVIL